MQPRASRAAPTFRVERDHSRSRTASPLEHRADLRSEETLVGTVAQRAHEEPLPGRGLAQLRVIDWARDWAMDWARKIRRASVRLTEGLFR